MTTIKVKLEKFKLRTTPCREEVLQLFELNHFAQSQGEIESELANQFDRVTIYRTLKSFLSSGLIHKVLDDEGGVKYALCKELCHHQEGAHHQHDHVHFKCIQCGQTTCLEIEIPKINLPEGYIKQESNLLIQGKCFGCNYEL
ncbi:transcriptional repressor [Sandaracinomonas limnophila]|uniref:Transcriptional repressor n=1 Tax=Sandaracinomonas limnophila TaxID=1862386 RepID=A0A437PS56_9BACT|nr:transcriptional repressor [Sandaracinomonas limnophila]RVU25077.1 transcriptional repressor [Sandaracinomonas limnophila]